MPEYIDQMLDLIKAFSDQVLVTELHEAISNRFPASKDSDFDEGLDNLCALFKELL